MYQITTTKYVKMKVLQIQEEFNKNTVLVEYFNINLLRIR